jgi:hypothetical protein
MADKETDETGTFRSLLIEDDPAPEIVIDELDYLATMEFRRSVKPADEDNDSEQG